MTRVAARMMAGAAGADTFPDSYVRFTTTGATFNPAAECASGTVIWQCEETGAILTGLSPTFTWGSSATRHVRMGVLAGSGLAGITTVNLGFNYGDDTGRYSPGAGYNKNTQLCTGIENVILCTGLVRFLAARGPNLVENPLTGALDLTGLSSLEFIECYYANLQTVTLTGCTSLIRLCVEHNKLTALNLNPVAGSLYDLRCSTQQTGVMTFTALTSPLAHDYHICIHDNNLGGSFFADADRPVAEEVWIWSNWLYGALDVSTAAGTLTSLQAYTNALTSVDLTGCDSLTSILLHQNSLNQAAVDAILAEAESWGTSSRTLNLGGNNAPSAAGLADKATLEGRGWTVTVAAAPTVGVNSDDFERTAANIAAFGSGWYAWSGATASLDGHDLVYAGTGYNAVVNPGDALPPDYEVTVVIPEASRGAYRGLWLRWNGVHGVRLLWTTSMNGVPTVGDAAGWNIANVTVTTDAGYPATWTEDRDHTIRVKATGPLIELFIDEQATRTHYATCYVNYCLTDTGYGICKGMSASPAWRSIVAASV